MTIVSGRAATESSCQHRTVERDELAADREKCEHRREIAVSDERLPRAACLIAIEERQQLDAAVPATDANHTGYRFVAPRGLNRRRPHARRTCDITIPRKHRVVIHRHEPQPPDFDDPPIEFLAR